MRLFRLYIVAGVALVAGCHSDDAGDGAPKRTAVDVWEEASTPADRLTRLLEPRDVPLELFNAVMPDEVKQASEKLKQAAQLDPHGFLSAMALAPDEEPPPYDLRLGVTQEEYELLVRGPHLQLQKKGSGERRIVIEQIDDHTFMLSGLPDLEQLKIDTASQTIKTPYGDVSRPTPFDASAAQQLTGPMNGYKWNESAISGTMKRYRIQEVLLGQTVDTGDVWLEARIIDMLQDTTVVEYFARFPGPQE